MRREHAVALVRQVKWRSIVLLLKGAAATFLRVNLSLLLAAAWTIPVGVAIGFIRGWRGWRSRWRRSRLRSRRPRCFPCSAGADPARRRLGIGSIALMLLGTQWYILFNVIAGAMAIRPT
jgi:NitT/TauT family transport system permease protein